MKHGAGGLTCSALHGCRYGIFITQLDALTLRHNSATADYILCPVDISTSSADSSFEQRSSGSLITRTPSPTRPSGAAQLVHETQLTGSVKVIAPTAFT